MKLFLLALVFALVIAALAADAPQKQVIITYPQNTPVSILDQAKSVIKAAGGVITHEYALITGFAATVSSKALETVNTLSAEYKPTIEEDQIVTINGGSS